jgi:hypothetical protein
MAFLEDAESIQASLMETINALVRNTIDFRRAQLILRALHIAAKNAPRAHFNFSRPSMVDEVPQYPAAPEPKPIEAALEQAGVLIYAGRPSLPKWATMAARSISASADPTRPKSPSQVSSTPIAKALTTGRSRLGDEGPHPAETGLQDDHLDSMLRYNLGHETNATKTK